jgi:hypothetical protein
LLANNGIPLLIYPSGIFAFEGHIADAQGAPVQMALT